MDNPGVWTDIEATRLLHPRDRDRITTALTQNDYTLVPEEPLWQTYDGAWDPDVFAPSGGTWWIRFFDYI
ncbi:MAG: hypothetical protein HOV77_14720 [Hamadaea sp.]|nr:hypothetical protein [Hamadaea sp.]